MRLFSLPERKQIALGARRFVATVSFISFFSLSFVLAVIGKSPASQASAPASENQNVQYVDQNGQVVEVAPGETIPEGVSQIDPQTQAVDANTGQVIPASSSASKNAAATTSWAASPGATGTSATTTKTNNPTTTGATATTRPATTGAPSTTAAPTTTRPTPTTTVSSGS